MDETSSSEALTIDQLRLFLAVVDEGSFSAAARALRRAQSAVSYGIANLERQLEVQLFDRTTRTPSLTPAGKELSAEARAVCDQVDRLRAHARGITRGIEPNLAIAVDHLFPLQALTNALTAFREQFPTVSLALHTESLGAVWELVARGTCSVGIGSPISNPPEPLERVPITRVTMVNVAAPSHPLARLRGRGPLSPHVVREHVQIVVADRSRLTEGQQFGVYTDRTWRVLDLSTKHALLRAGLGWGGMPKHVVAEDIAKKRLVRLQLEEAGNTDVEATLYAIHRAAEPPGPAARWLLDRLAAKGGEG
jgi:DNA-binding transcriptional LysR family regulator